MDTANWIFPKAFIINPRGENADGSETTKDRDNRSKTIWFMEDMSRLLNMDRRVLYTASVYFHRFYLFHSFQTQNRFHVALACLFLSGKVEEKAYKLKELVHSYFLLRYRRKPDDTEFRDTMKQVILAERLVLHTLNFDLTMYHPYTAFVTKMRDWRGFVPEESRKQLMQTAVNFLNDTYRSTFCLEYTPQEIAVAVFYLATITLSIRPISSNVRTNVEFSWMSILDKEIMEYRLRCICLEIMEMYEQLAFLLRESEDVAHRVERQRIAGHLITEMNGIVPEHITITKQQWLETQQPLGQDSDNTTADAMTPREKALSIASVNGDNCMDQPLASRNVSTSSSHSALHRQMSEDQDPNEKYASHDDMLMEETFQVGSHESRRPMVTVTNFTSSSHFGNQQMQHGYERGDLSTVSSSTGDDFVGASSQAAMDETPVYFQHQVYQQHGSYQSQAPSDTPTFSDLAASSNGGGSGMKSVSGRSKQRSRSNSLSEYSEYNKRMRAE